MTARWVLITIVVALCVRAPGVAAAGDEFSRRDPLTLSASDRVRGEFVSWFDPAGPKSNNNYDFFANRLRAGATLSFSMLEVVVEGQDTELVNLPGADAINSGPDTACAPHAVWKHVKAVYTNFLEYTTLAVLVSNHARGQQEESVL